MPESKCIVRLNPDAVPSIQIHKSNSKISVNPRQESLHILKKRQTEIIDDIIKTSTPKKKMISKSSCFEEIDDVSAIEEPDVNNKIKKTSEMPFDVQKECNTHIPKNIYRTPRPPYEVLKSKRYSRFT